MPWIVAAAYLAALFVLYVVGLRYKCNRCFQATCLGSGIGPWQEVVDLAVGVIVDDLCDDVGQIGLRFDAAELASLNQRGYYARRHLSEPANRAFLYCTTVNSNLDLLI